MDTIQQDTQTLAQFLRAHPRLVVLTGAGVSSASGIPTYRDELGNWQHRAPILEQAFLRDADTRRRYWARSWYGWPMMRDALPNAAHIALAQLELRGRIELLITQNVDGLHQRAGSKNVVDLHGRVDRVLCLGCGAEHSRDSVQALLGRHNHWPENAARQRRPDGDMDVAEELCGQITLPRCQHCAGDLKPDVVFYGGSVPPSTVQRCHDALARCDALLAVGSSLMVFSAFRFCRRAQQLGKPVVIINPGVTRADHLAEFKLPVLAGPLLAQVLVQMDQEASPLPNAETSKRECHAGAEVDVTAQALR